MKQCESCGCRTADANTYCPNCGGTRFKGGEAPRPVDSGKPGSDKPVTGKPGGGGERTTSHSERTRTPKPKVEWWPELPQGAGKAAIAALVVAGLAIVAYVIYWLVPPTIVDVEPAGNVTLLYPNFDRVDLAVEVLPSTEDDNIIMCIAAATSSNDSKLSVHERIGGPHVNTGEYNTGFIDQKVSGVFTWAGGKWRFGTRDEANTLLQDAAQRGGMGFMQQLLVKDGEIVPPNVVDNRSLECRALCDKKGKLFVVNADTTMTRDEFVSTLVDSIGVSNAICLQWESPKSTNVWNYGWYRDNDGKVVNLHHKPLNPGTNWIVFYK